MEWNKIQLRAPIQIIENREKKCFFFFNLFYVHALPAIPLCSLLMHFEQVIHFEEWMKGGNNNQQIYEII